MNFSGLPRLLWRRWYVTLSGLALTIVLCALAGSAVPPKYQAQGNVLLLPAAKSVGVGGNPYLALGGLTQASDVLAKALSDSTAADAVDRSGVGGKYTAITDPTSSAPMLLITATNTTPRGALDTLRELVALTAPTMQRIQSAIAVPADYQITTKVVSTDSKATVIHKNQIRAIVAAAAIGVLLTVLGVALATTLAERLARRRFRTVNKTNQTAGGRSTLDSDLLHKISVDSARAEQLTTSSKALLAGVAARLQRTSQQDDG